MTEKQFLDKGGVQIIADKINTLAAVTDKLMDLDHAMIISAGEFAEITPDVDTVYGIYGEGEGTTLGDVLLYNTKKTSFEYYSADDLSKLGSEYEPIGIVVIPATHNVYGDGMPGIMALKAARTDTPDTGGAEQGISWGTYGTENISELPDYTTIGLVDYTINILANTNTALSSSDVAYLATDFGTTVVGEFNSKYGWTAKQAVHIAPIFAEDGSISGCTMRDALVIASGATKTTTYLNLNNDTEYPLFAGIRAIADDWYLPTVYELACAISNRNALNEILTAAGVQKIESQDYWTVDSYSSTEARYISANTGCVSHAAAANSKLVRAFKTVSAASVVGQFYNGSAFVDSYDSSCVGISVRCEGTTSLIMSLQHVTTTGFGTATGVKFSTLSSFSKTSNTGNIYGCDDLPTVTNDIISTSSWGRMPSDNFNGALSPDGVSKYYPIMGPYVPSPYNADGTKNKNWSKYCCSDYNGYTNTAAILSHVTLENWQTLDSIPDTYTTSRPAGEYPAACACWRYSTVGTEQGDWYLPACGEFGYVCARMKAINTVISKINTWKPNSAVSLTSNWYWTSTEYSAWDARTVNLDIGLVNGYYRYFQFRVRPFLRVSF
jgi:hypothetical protein